MPMPRTAPSPAALIPRVAGDDRDLVADVARSGALLVVVAWHWVFSITHRRADGSLAMPNPVDEIPYGWALTWALQVMPAFFVVSGAVNVASLRRRPGAETAWVRARLGRLAIAVGVVVAACAAFEAAAWALFGQSGWTLRHIPVLVPLWTVAILIALTPLTPVADRAWRHSPVATLATVAGVLALAEVARFAGGVELAGLASTGAVWAGAYLLGFFYRDIVDGVRSARLGPVLMGSGLVGLAVLTTAGPYPMSMVATRTDAISNLWPTSAPVLALAVLQAGVLVTLGERLHRRLDRPGIRRRVDATGSLGLPVYLLHMFALVLFVHALEGAGLELPDDTSAGWWSVRPVFLVGPAVLLVPMVLVLRRLLR